jgi:FkbM family methyltransferase
MKCAVVTPIGPGHQDAYALCRQSVEQAFAQHPGPFNGLELIGLDDSAGLHGRSARRNDGITLARQKGCEWLFFLDADDLMAGQAFEIFERHHQELDAVWGLICQNQFGQDGMELRTGQLREIDDIRDILTHDPTATLQMGHFVRTELADAIRFDSTMNTGEDFKYYLQLWRMGRCRKVPDILFVNRRGYHSQGPRSANGHEWRVAVQEVLQDFARKNPFVVPVADIGVEARFAVDNPFDLIQRHHLHGRFFESTELQVLRDAIPAGGTIADVGANIGNHLVFFAKALAPRKIIPVEPGARAVEMLQRNIALNDIGCVDTRLLGIGAGGSVGSFELDIHQPDNLGASRLQASRDGQIKVYPLDDKIREKVDFLKIDVEGMEMEVLHGARGLIGHYRPRLFIEIANANLQAFSEWAGQNRYVALNVWRYVNSVNYLLAPAH